MERKQVQVARGYCGDLMAPQKGSQRKRGSCAVRGEGKPSGYAEAYLGCDCPGCEISPKPHTVTGLALRAEAADTRDSVPLKHEMSRVSMLSVQPLSRRLQSNSRCSARQTTKRNSLYKFCETGPAMLALGSVRLACC